MFETSSSLNELIFKSYIVEWIEILIKFINELSKEHGEKTWKTLGKLQWRMGRKWIKENLSRLGIKGEDAIAGAEIVRLGLQTLAPGLYSQREFKIVDSSPKKVVVEMSAWCPVLEACKKMNIDPEIPLNYLVRQRLLGMLQTVNPKLNMDFIKIDKNTLKCQLIIEVLD